jgi:hypothetical protein
LAAAVFRDGKKMRGGAGRMEGQKRRGRERENCREEDRGGEGGTGSGRDEEKEEEEKEKRKEIIPALRGQRQEDQED